MTTDAVAIAAPTNRLEQVGVAALLCTAGAVQFSIAAGQTLFAVAIACWLILLVSRRERFAAPAMFWPLAAYAAITLCSAAFSPEPGVSLADCKQLVLFLIVPVAYRFLTGPRSRTMVMVILTCGAASAAYGIFEYAILNYDNLHLRVQGTLGHYMTYSGLLMLIIGTAVARILFDTRDRLWATLVMPALAVAVAVTFTRSAVVGACAAAALLLSLKDFRLLAILPVIAMTFIVVAPTRLTARYLSIINVNDPTNRDRLAMLREGRQMVRAHPLVGVGPSMVEHLYPEFRDPDAVEAINPHLHNVPVQIAAERGLPALAVWLWFIGTAIVELVKRFRFGDRFLAATGLAAIASMLAAGMFEYNFGDSEFLMMFLLLVTLPFAAARPVNAVTTA